MQRILAGTDDTVHRAPIGETRAMAQSVRTASLLDDPTTQILGGAIAWLPLRRRLGVTAIGTNAYRAARAGDEVLEEHTERPGTEELYVVIAGAARFTADDETVDAAAGTVVFYPDAATRRHAVATEDDTVVLAVGGVAGEVYRPLPWEPAFLTHEAAHRGDWAQALAILEREAGEHRAAATVRFHAACFQAQLGDLDAAVAELRDAVAERPDLRASAATETLLAPLHDRAEWPGLVAH